MIDYIDEFLIRIQNGENTTAEDINVHSTDVPNQPKIPPMPPVKLPKKEKIRRIYEDDDFIIDLFSEEPMVRVSIFKDGHFKDEVIIKESDYVD